MVRANEWAVRPSDLRRVCDAAAGELDASPQLSHLTWFFFVLFFFFCIAVLNTLFRAFLYPRLRLTG